MLLVLVCRVLFLDGCVLLARCKLSSLFLSCLMLCVVVGLCGVVVWCVMWAVVVCLLLLCNVCCLLCVSCCLMCAGVHVVCCVL